MQLSCFYCGKPLSTTVEQLGSEVECPHCFKLVRLPEPEELKEEQEAPPFIIPFRFPRLCFGLAFGDYPRRAADHVCHSYL